MLDITVYVMQQAHWLSSSRLVTFYMLAHRQLSCIGMSQVIWNDDNANTLQNQHSHNADLAWHITRTLTWPSVGSSCCKVAMTNTAVFPIPLLA